MIESHAASEVNERQPDPLRANEQDEAGARDSSGRDNGVGTEGDITSLLLAIARDTTTDESAMPLSSSTATSEWYFRFRSVVNDIRE